MNEFHPLLKRQLKRFDIDLENQSIPENIKKFILHVNNAYQESEQGKYTIERSLELSSQEMRELRENLQREKEVMQAVMSEGLCVIDPFWKISSLNVTGGKLVCCSQQTVIGRFFYEVFTLFDGENLDSKEIDIDILREKFKKGEIYHCDKGYLKTFHGVTRPISFSINPLPFINNKIFGGAVLIFRDITELLENEHVLRSSLQMAQQSNQAKSQFLANMSHEIRTPMNGILGMLQLLQCTNLEEKQKHYVDKSFDCATSLLKIIGDILDFSKIEAGKVDLESIDFNLKKEFDEMLIIFNTLGKDKQIHIQLKYDDSIPDHLKGDPLRIKQILTNLVNNAIKFTPAKGDITITASPIELYENYIILQISVSDTGIGISETYQEKIFNVFSQADESTTRKYGGTGLGLAITKQLVEQMHGHIYVNSVEGKGSTFSFNIKLNRSLVSDIKYQQAQKSGINETLGKFDANILVVEDNELNQMVIHDFLDNIGCSIRIVSSGKEALNVLETENFDLIFMDCHMPEMDGFKTTQKIREAEFKKKINNEIFESNVIVALTADTLIGTEERCLDAGMNDYITKPLNYSQLYETLKKHLPEHKHTPSEVEPPKAQSAS